MEELSLTVRDMTGVNTLRPVTGGVPIAEGAAPAGSAFALRDEEDNPIPLQTSVLARWKDGSASRCACGISANGATASNRWNKS